MWHSWWRRRVTRKHSLPEADWRAALAQLPLSGGLSEQEHRTLRALSVRFLYEKSFEPAGGLKLTDAMKLIIAVQACLPVLGLGLDYYRGWVSVIVYPDSFLVDFQYTDEAGVVHRERRLRAGEAWQRGPLILSWTDVISASEAAGFNVVIHECAHKLDMLDGTVNGLPPLHEGMQVEEWARVFTAAYQDLCGQVDAGGQTILHPYATESPAEFFAVVSETFFTRPVVLQQIYPEAYQQLQDFYRQDTASRLNTGQGSLS